MTNKHGEFLSGKVKSCS